MAAAQKRKKSREEYELELRRLKAMYAALPPEKQAVHRAHMQARMDVIVKAINGKGGGRRSNGLLETVSLVLLISVLALGAGFFGVTYLARTSDTTPHGAAQHNEFVPSP